MTDVHAFELSAQPHHHHHPHGHDHDHPHDHSHDHDHEHSWWVGIASALHLPGYAHTHDRPAASDPAYANELGIRALRVAFALLIATTLLQVVIYLSSGSVALLADTVHNLGDALNSVPLWIAFLIMRRVPNRRYTYGYGRAEDLAGLVIVASIVFSAGYILWEAAQKLINPEPLTNLGWVAAAAIIGFIGNEAVALIQIRTGRQIGSAAMIADGKHARIDGLTSLAVLGAATGTWLGFPLLDPIIGLLIGVTIVFIARDAALSIWYRLMDAVDPALLAKVEQVLASHEEIREVKRVQLRWLGHRLQASIVVGLDDCFDLAACAELSEHLRHHLLHELPHLEDAIIAATPCAGSALTPREAAHHQQPGR